MVAFTAEFTDNLMVRLAILNNLSPQNFRESVDQFSHLVAEDLIHIAEAERHLSPVDVQTKKKLEFARQFLSTESILLRGMNKYDEGVFRILRHAVEGELELSRK